MTRSLRKTPVAAALTVNDPRWAAVMTRDADAGSFFYSVETTGVYCRASCAARLARPENVRFHSTCEEAETAGYRPCMRCKPNQRPLLEQHTAMVAQACQSIDGAEAPPCLQQLANSACLSSSHFHRIFKSIVGLTPAGYAAAVQAQRLRNKLASSSTITEAIYDAGYNSSGRFYERSNQVLGMTPSNYRKGGVRTSITFAVGECSLGSVLVASSQRGVCAILLGDDPGALARDLQDRFPRANLVGGDSEFEQVVSQIVGLVEAPAIGLDLPLDIQGTAFQERVWRALQQIPAGTTASYTAIAAKLGLPKAVRAVANACGANPLAIAIPCHRVIRNNGEVSQYRWGIERKRSLLEREAQV